MIEVNLVNFVQETKTGLVLLTFGTKWCGPCRVMAPVLEQLTNVKVCKIDTEESPEITQSFDVMVMPTYIFLKDGVVMEPGKRIVGVQKQMFLQAIVDQYNNFPKN